MSNKPDPTWATQAEIDQRRDEEWGKPVPRPS